MEQFRTIYRILKALQRAMDYESPDSAAISAEALGISVPMWRSIMYLLVRAGYIRGVNIIERDDGELPFVYMLRRSA